MYHIIQRKLFYNKKIILEREFHFLKLSLQL